MRFLLMMCGLVLPLCVASPRPACAHVVDEVVQLGFNGWLAPFGDSGAEEYTDVWAQGDVAYLGTVGSGVAVINLDTGAFPSGVLRNPELITTYAPAGHVDFQDVKVHDTLGFFSGGAGTDVVDLSNPAAPALLSRIDATRGGFQAPKNTALGGDYLYQVSAASPEIRVFDLSNPSAPSLVRSINTGDSVGLLDLTLVGDRLYAAGAGGGAYVYDVSTVGSSTPALDFAVPSGANTASVWPMADGETLLVTHREPGGKLSAWHVASTPALVEEQSAGDFGFNSYSASEVVVVGSLAYVAWHQGGIQVVDLDSLDTLGMQRAGFWFIVGTDNFNGFHGVRSVYPWLGNEQLLISDTKRGLWRFDTTEIPNSIPGDYNGDGQVDQLDYTVWSTNYGTTLAAADGNGDGTVDAADYTVWRDAYDATLSASAAAATPEPHAALLLLLALTTTIHPRHNPFGWTP